MWNDVGFTQNHGWHGGATNSLIRIHGVNPQDSLRSGSRGLNHGYIFKHHFNDVGGTDVYNLKVEEMPAHNHTGTTSTNGNHNHTVRHRGIDKNGGWLGTHHAGRFGVSDRGYYNGETNNPHPFLQANGNHNHTFTTANTGNGWGHGVSNPYYVLTYIMKL